MDNHKQEVDSGQRFQFGRNWMNFVELVDQERVREAEISLRKMLGVSDLEGKRFLDIGCGSGLFSLAARNLGAEVRSFDYDPQSVAATTAMKSKFKADDEGWEITEGSVLDANFLETLGTFDVVYSWGVLHHTGDMWHAIDNACQRVAESGTFFISIYNHQIYWTNLATKMKRAYVESNSVGKSAILGAFAAMQLSKGFARDVVIGQNPMKRFRDKKKSRGMSTWYDMVDWVGGYPFETAKPEEIFGFCRERGFELQNLKTCWNGQGCNEFVFVRDD